MAVHFFETLGSWPRLRSGAEYQYEEVAFEGCTFGEGHESTRIMSDVWGTRYFAEVWNAEEGRPERVTLCVVDYCRGSGSVWHEWGHRSYAEADATPEVEAAREAYNRAEAEAKTARRFERNVAEGRARASEVGRGSYVELSRKRCKVPFGTRGEVFWVGESHYGPRVGFNGDDGETYWTALRNVSVVEGHEDWSSVCPECGGGGWVPANDGKGGTAPCSECARRHEEAKASEVRYGSRVEITGGRSAGVTGEVFWVGQNKYGPGLRFGVKDANSETHWANEEEVRAAA